MVNVNIESYRTVADFGGGRQRLIEELHLGWSPKAACETLEYRNGGALIWWLLLFEEVAKDEPILQTYPVSMIE